MAQFLILTTCLIFLGPPFPYLCDGISNSVIELLQGLESWQLMSAAAAESLQSCPTLCDPIDGSPPGSLVPGILQARTLEWVAISFSSAWKWKVKVKLLSHVRLSNPMDCSQPGSSVHGIFQARVLEWGAIAFSNHKGRNHKGSSLERRCFREGGTLCSSKRTPDNLFSHESL